MKIVDIPMETRTMECTIATPPPPPEDFECALGDAMGRGASPGSDDQALDESIRRIIVQGLIELSRDQRQDRIRMEMRVVVLSEMGMTERDLDCMPSEVCKALDREVERRVEQRLRIEIEHSVDSGWVQADAAHTLLLELE